MEVVAIVELAKKKKKVQISTNSKSHKFWQRFTTQSEGKKKRRKHIKIWIKSDNKHQMEDAPYH